MGVTIAIWVLSMFAETHPQSEVVRKEFKALDGDWLLVRYEQKGRKHDPRDGAQSILTIRGAQWSFPSTQEVLEVTALNPAANPKTIDFRITHQKAVTNPRGGIYKRDGDTFVLVMYQGPDRKRPAGFDTPTEPHTVLYVFQRVK